jgi:hypothetical protein
LSRRQCAVQDLLGSKFSAEFLFVEAFTLLLCCTDLQVILFLSACFEAAILEDGVREHYFAMGSKGIAFIARAAKIAAEIVYQIAFFRTSVCST